MGKSTNTPGRNCPLCPRLVDFRHQARAAHGDWHNAPVDSFGPKDSDLLIVGLAPGMRGANCTGRPFTGDFAGDLLYATLQTFGFCRGEYGASAADGLQLVNCRITNAVRCVPPENKPVAAEVNACRPFLIHEIETLAYLRIILALGTLAHNAVLRALGHKQSAAKFSHNARHALPGGLILADSYHCSRYNTNTGRLTEAMFHDVFRELRTALDPA
jgi:uracil-DNA glycosylase family 4